MLDLLVHWLGDCRIDHSTSQHLIFSKGIAEGMLALSKRAQARENAMLRSGGNLTAWPEDNGNNNYNYNDNKNNNDNNNDNDNDVK